MNLYEWHWARLKGDLDLKDSFVRVNTSFILPKGTIIRAKNVQVAAERYLTFIEHSNNILDTFYISYESLLEPLKK